MLRGKLVISVASIYCHFIDPDRMPDEQRRINSSTLASDTLSMSVLMHSGEVPGRSLFICLDEAMISNYCQRCLILTFERHDSSTTARHITHDAGMKPVENALVDCSCKDKPVLVAVCSIIGGPERLYSCRVFIGQCG